MRILIVGLGLIGGSYAKALTKKGHTVYAMNRTMESIEYAKKEKIIVDGKGIDDVDYLSEFGHIVFALYPKYFVEFIKKYKDKFKEGTIFTDVTGVKKDIVKKVQDILPEGIEFIPAHPMAGKEVLGIKNADDKIFENANYIITPTKKNTELGIRFARKIGKVIGFRKISTLSIDEHDDMIAFLSQLTHCIAISLMTCKDSKNLVDYTGDSFRDLTRIAHIDENMWTELFLMNKKYLVKEMNSFIEHFTLLRDYIENEDVDAIKNEMRISTKRRDYFNNY